MLSPNRHYGSFCNVRLSANWQTNHAGLHWAAVTAREGFFVPLTSIPSGYAAPGNGSIPAIRSGAMATYRAPVITTDASAIGALGRNLEATAAIQILAAATGGLIAGGVASATVAIIASAEVVAAIKGDASASITITGMATAAAIGFASAAATITVQAQGQPMGLGFMVATTEEAGLTPAGIARAVWAAIAAANNAAGSMGEKLNLAGSGGVDSGALADAILARSLAGGADGGRTVRDALRASRNRVVISGSTLTVYAEDDTTVAWTATITTAQRDALQGVDPA